MEDEGQRKYAPSASDVSVACEVLNALSRVDEEQLLEFAPYFGRIILAWVASLDLDDQEDS